MSENNRRARCYTRTAAGRRQLTAERAEFDRGQRDSARAAHALTQGLHMRAFFRRLWHVLRQSRHDAELREELEAHRALRQAQLERDGLTPTEAARSSRRALGNVLLACEDVRGEWVSPLIEDVWQDVRVSARRLTRRPVFAAAAVLTFALGIGANTAVFSVLETLLLQQLRVPRPEELFSLVRVGARDRASARLTSLSSPGRRCAHTGRVQLLEQTHCSSSSRSASAACSVSSAAIRQRRIASAGCRGDSAPPSSASVTVAIQ